MTREMRDALLDLAGLFALFLVVIFATGCAAGPGPTAQLAGFAYIEAREIPYPGGTRICFVAWSGTNSAGLALDCPLDLTR